MLLAHGADRRDGRARQRAPVFMSSLSGQGRRARQLGLRGDEVRPARLRARRCARTSRRRASASPSILPGFIRDAGMFADSGAKLPPYVGTKRPEDVARAVVKAIEHNRAELDVAPLPLRAGALLGGLAPGPVGAIQRRLGAAKTADAIGARPDRQALRRGGRRIAGRRRSQRPRSAAASSRRCRTSPPDRVRARTAASRRATRATGVTRPRPCSLPCRD